MPVIFKFINAQIIKLDNLSSIETKQVVIDNITFTFSKMRNVVTCSFRSQSTPSTNDAYKTITLIPEGWEPIHYVCAYGSSSANTAVGYLELNISENSRNARYKYKGSSFSFGNFSYICNNF